VIGNGHAGFGRGDAGKGPARAPRQHPHLTRRPPAKGQTLKRRHEGQPAHIVEIAWQAQRRLHRVWQRLDTQRGKRRTIVAVAVARELTGFCWALANAD
jgi:transposase